MRLAIPFLVALVTACGPKIEAERSTIATFGRYNSYAWRHPPAPARTPAESDAALLDYNIHDAVDATLAAKGYVRRTDRTATLLIDYDVAPPEESTAAFPEYQRYRRRGEGEPIAAGMEPGTLAVQLVDPRTGVVAYRAAAKELLEDGGTVGVIDDAVTRMFEELPAAAR